MGEFKATVIQSFSGAIEDVKFNNEALYNTVSKLCAELAETTSVDHEIVCALKKDAASLSCNGLSILDNFSIEPNYNIPNVLHGVPHLAIPYHEFHEYQSEFNTLMVKRARKRNFIETVITPFLGEIEGVKINNMYTYDVVFGICLQLSSYLDLTPQIVEMLVDDVNSSDTPEYLTIKENDNGIPYLAFWLDTPEDKFPDTNKLLRNIIA